MKALPLLSFVLVVCSLSCTKTYDCFDNSIGPAFVQYSLADIDTIIIKKYQQKNNFQNLLDSGLFTINKNAYYSFFHDTTYISLRDESLNIVQGYDWQIFLPSTNRTILITDIVSENKKGKRGVGLFSLDPGVPCSNEIFSVKKDNKKVEFTTSPYSGYSLFISP